MLRAGCLCRAENGAAKRPWGLVQELLPTPTTGELMKQQGNRPTNRVLFSLGLVLVALLACYELGASRATGPHVVPLLEGLFLLALGIALLPKLGGTSLASALALSWIVSGSGDLLPSLAGGTLAAALSALVLCRGERASVPVWIPGLFVLPLLGTASPSLWFLPLIGWLVFVAVSHAASPPERGLLESLIGLRFVEVEARWIAFSVAGGQIGLFIGTPDQTSPALQLCVCLVASVMLLGAWRARRASRTSPRQDRSSNPTVRTQVRRALSWDSWLAASDTSARRVRTRLKARGI